MVFSSTVFLLAFLPTVIILYYLVPKGMRNGVLLLGSLLFYGFGEPRYLLIMLVSILFNYGCGLAIPCCKNFGNNEHRPARLMLCFAALGNLIILGYFKYAGFFFGRLGFPEVVLPIGISFYTFQAMSYVIDVYREKAASQKNLLRFALYITLFPQLIAGPIVRYVTIQMQLAERESNLENFAEGARRFVMGLGKKVLLANQAGLIWDEISSMNIDQMPAATAWLGAIAFTFQIYFDFGGYSDMAIGLGRMFGFHFEENFNYPYTAKNITDFWRRWHISLSTWFKEYVYIPLGGNRKGMSRQVVNIFIVWALTGFWHGASWNFLWWGVYFGILLILEKVFLLRVLEKLPCFVQHAYALFFIVLGWVIFALTDGTTFFAYLKAMAFCSGLWNGRSGYFLATSGMLLVIMAFASTQFPSKRARAMFGKLQTKPAVYLTVKNVTYLLILTASMAFLVSDTYNPFLYFRF